MPYLTLFDSYTYVDLMLEVGTVTGWLPLTISCLLMEQHVIVNVYFAEQEIKMIVEHMEAVSPAMNTLYTQLGQKINQLYFIQRQQKDGNIIRVCVTKLVSWTLKLHDHLSPLWL